MTKEFKIDDLPVTIYDTNDELGYAAAMEGQRIIVEAIHARGVANIILATGNSQLSFLRTLRRSKEIAWEQVNVFHMDEYINLPSEHPASFPLFLQRELLDYVKVKQFFPVQAKNGEIERICHDYAAALHAHPIDLCALGIGENGHLAFNDPPYAEFNDPVWVKAIRLAEASRQQQVGEGHFKNLAEVPTHAITLTIPCLLAAKRVLAIVPEARKAEAVYKSLREPVSENCPGSKLRHTPHAHLFLDKESAVKL